MSHNGSGLYVTFHVHSVHVSKAHPFLKLSIYNPIFLCYNRVQKQLYPLIIPFSVNMFTFSPSLLRQAGTVLRHPMLHSGIFVLCPPPVPSTPALMHTGLSRSLCTHLRNPAGTSRPCYLTIVPSPAGRLISPVRQAAGNRHGTADGGSAINILRKEETACAV